MEQGVFQSCRYSQVNSDIIDHHQHHWAAVVSRGWAKASACRLQVNPLVRSSARSCPSRICSGRLYTACGWFPLWYGLQVVMYVHEFHRSSLNQLVCPVLGPLHFSHITDYVYDFCPLPDPDVGLSVPVCDGELYTTFDFGLGSTKFVLWLVTQSV